MSRHRLVDEYSRRAGEDQLALELGEPAKHRHISRLCGVVVSAQASPKDLKPAPALPDRIENVEQIARGAGQPVEPRHHEHVAGLKPPEHLGQLGAVSRAPLSFLAYTLAQPAL